MSEEQPSAPLDELFQSFSRTATESLRMAQTCVDAMDERIRTLAAELDDERRRRVESDRRRLAAERSCATMEEQASRTVTLEDACARLLDALDRLPLAMAEAGVIPSAAPPEIALYGTYEWQAVADTKHALAHTLKKGGEREPGGA